MAIFSCRESSALRIVVVLMALMSSAFAVRKLDSAQVAAASSHIRPRRSGDVKGLLEGQNLDANVDFQEKDSLVTAQGTMKRKYTETYNGYTVFDTRMDVEVDNQGYKRFLVGDIYTDFGEDLRGAFDCVLSRHEGKEITLAHFGMESADVRNRVFEELIYVDDTDVAHFALSVDLFVFKTDGAPSRPNSIIDICSKTVLDAYDRIGFFFIGGQNTDECGPADPNNCDVKDKAGNPKRVINVGEGSYCLNPMRRSSDNATCYLENQYIIGVDLDGTTNDGKTTVASFRCADGYDDEVNGGFSPMLDGFLFGTKSLLMYRDWYNYAPLTDPIPYVKVHYGRNYENAYWDGTSMVFGDGDGRETYPWTNMDTVAHEAAHGVTERASNLIYRNQPGGMNEAFSDMVGEAAEEYLFGESDWVSGAELFFEEGMALRYFDDPTKDGFSIKHVRDYFSGMSVHSSSGVYNHVFWHMGQDMGIRAAFECFLTANRLYWTARTNFESGACGTLRGAYDGGYDMQKVEDSFNVVGITLSQCSDIPALVTTELTSGITQEGLAVSNIRQPLFKINVPSDATTVVVTGSNEVEVVISTSWDRSVTPIATGTGTATATVASGSTVYARFHADSETTDVTASVTFS